jgi:uncharacterized protein (DUF885 family)
VREPSTVDGIAEDYFEGLSDLYPSISLFLGLDNDRGFDDYSPAGFEAAKDLRARALNRLADLETTAAMDGSPSLDDTDDVTIDAMRERFSVADDLFDSGLSHTVLNVIESPVQQMRDIFDLVPTRTTRDWETITSTLAGLPASISGYQESLTYAQQRMGRTPARVQIERVREQSRSLAKENSRFDTLVDGAANLSTGLRKDLAAAAAAAKDSFAELSDSFAELMARAHENEACGRDAYALHSRNYLGAEVDFEETYSWALDELNRIDSEQKAIARAIAPGVELFDVMAMLDNDPHRALHGTEALQARMQDVADEAIEKLGQTHFDIPAPLRTIECMIAPSATGAVYYSQPSEDFSRPGRMWWSVPHGVTEFATWQEKTTVYHEGVPGHHLQMGQASYLADSLNRWRRHVCWVSGHGEGWALYAEQLMEELGFLNDPADRLGMLDAQRLRTTRVALDIGFHLGLKAPTHLGGGTWDRAKAWQFLKDNVATDRTFLAFELDRYLGWPGQAPSYKIGHRLWQQIRHDAEAEAGETFDLKGFHSKALNLGSLGLDTLSRAMRR